MTDMLWLPPETPADGSPPDLSHFIGRLRLDTRTMGPSFFEAFDAAMDQAEIDVDAGRVRVIVVYAEHPKAFSYGLDLPAAFKVWGNLFRGGLAAEREQLRRLVGRLQRPFQRLHAIAVPTVCAVHGHCIGGGLDLAAACDIRLASDDASFSLRETRIAIVADLGSLQRLPFIIGQGLTRELAFTGRDVTAAEARAMQLVNATFADRDALLAGATSMATSIAANAPLTVRGVKAVLNRPMEAALRDGLDHVAAWNSAFLASEDLGEAVAAFVTKRPPSFRGR